MRQFRESQLPLRPITGRHEHSRELEEISAILDAHPQMAEQVQADLIGDRDPERGREGLSGEQVLRIALLRQIHGLSYRALEFHLEDSASFRAFSRLPYGDTPTFKTLQSNVKRIHPHTWESIHRALMQLAQAEGIERGEKIRGDCTPVEAPIHEPSDSSLLWDCVRVVTRQLNRLAQSRADLRGFFHDRCRRAKRRAREIAFSRRSHARKRLYRDLLRVACETRAEAREILEQLAQDAVLEMSSHAAELRQVLPRMDLVIEQTRRRVLLGESVPAHEKIVSIFEPHADILVKGEEVHYGHKVCLTGGRSSLILDCVIESGNPADSTLVERTLQRHIDLYGKAPRQACFDGGFASQANVARAKELGVKDIVFHKKRGIEVSEMARSPWIFRQLRNFRAGIEGCISTLKRAFEMDRSRWRGRVSFASYVWASVTSFNLVVLARHRLAIATT